MRLIRRVTVNSNGFCCNIDLAANSFILVFSWMIFGSRIKTPQSVKVAFRCLVKVRLIQKITIGFVINRFHYLYTFMIPG